MLFVNCSSAFNLHISSPIVLNTGVPQGCVLSHVLYTLYTHNCFATHDSNTLDTFVDD